MLPVPNQRLLFQLQQFMENGITVGYKIGLVCDLKRSVVLAQSSGIVVCSFEPHTYYKPTD